MPLEIGTPAPDFRVALPGKRPDERPDERLDERLDEHLGERPGERTVDLASYRGQPLALIFTRHLA